jgi:hypothetical protein
MSIKKIFSWVVLTLIIVILGVGTYVYYNIHSIANEILREQIIKDYNENKETKYLISLEEVKLNFLQGSIDLLNLDITPKDSLVSLESNLSKEVFESTSMTIHIEQISLRGFDYIKAFQERVIIADKFILNQPQLNVYQHEGETNETLVNQDTVDLRGIFLTHYDTFRINEISIKDLTTSINKVSLSNDTSNLFVVHNLSYQVLGVEANSQTIYSNKYFIFKEIKLASKNLAINLKQGGVISVGELAYDSKQNKLLIKNIELKPGKSPSQLFKPLQFRKAWVGLSVKQIAINQMEFINTFQTKTFAVSNIQVDAPVLKLFTNSNLPINTEIVKPMLGHLLMKVPFKFHVPELKITNASIEMDLIGKASEQHGLLAFRKMNIEASNITNIKDELTTNKYLTINAKTNINKAGSINAKIKIDLLSPDSRTNLSVKGTHLTMSKFNTILNPIARINITSGKIISLESNSIITSKSAFGTLDIHYEDLKLQLLSKDLDKKFINNIASGLANGLIKTNNIPGEKQYHQGSFNFDKLKEDSFFNLLWLVHLHGLEDSILGSDAKDQRKQNRKERKEEASKNGKKKWSISF